MMPTKTSTDCYDYYFNQGNATDGIYRISPPGIDPFDVWCDMTTDGGGWTVFQKRTDETTVFWNRPWADYKNGFNNGLAKNVWLGLDRVNILSTKDSNNLLRIDLHGNRCKRTGSSYHCDLASDPDNGYWYGEWASFNVEAEANKYRLHISPLVAGNISVSGSDPLYYFNNNKYFTTVDANNQEITAFNCAMYNEWGPWWYSGCSSFFLNGKYSATSGVGGYGFAVDHVDSTKDIGWVNPVRSEMKLRRINA